MQTFRCACGMRWDFIVIGKGFRPPKCECGKVMEREVALLNPYSLLSQEE